MNERAKLKDILCHPWMNLHQKTDVLEAQEVSSGGIGAEVGMPIPSRAQESWPRQTLNSVGSANSRTPPRVHTKLSRKPVPEKNLLSQPISFMMELKSIPDEHSTSHDENTHSSLSADLLLNSNSDHRSCRLNLKDLKTRSIRL